MASTTKSAGTPIASRSSIASIGSPAVIRPASGSMTDMGTSCSVSTTSIERAMPCSPVLMTPFSQSACMCWCTVAGDDSPNRDAISR